MDHYWQWLGACVAVVLLAASCYWYVERTKRMRRLFRPYGGVALASRFGELKELSDGFKKRRSGDFFDKWAEDLIDQKQSDGTASAVFQCLGDILTLGGSARRRQRAKEFAAAAYICQSTDELLTVASDEVQRHITVTADRIEFGLELLRKTQKITHPALRLASRETNLSQMVKRVNAIELRSRNLLRQHNVFVNIAEAAGAGTATAVGLWGAVQVAGFASTGTSMLGLHGAAASSAGWAWFGGGSLATGGGGMALGHMVLPGVGVAVAWGYLVSSLYRAANDIEHQIRELEGCNELNMPVLSEMIRVEEQYLHGTERFRSSLAALQLNYRRVSRRLRPFGKVSDWQRRKRVAHAQSYYTSAEMIFVEQLVASLDNFLDQLPATDFQ